MCLNSESGTRRSWRMGHREQSLHSSIYRSSLLLLQPCWKKTGNRVLITEGYLHFNFRQRYNVAHVEQFHWRSRNSRPCAPRIGNYSLHRTGRWRNGQSRASIYGIKISPSTSPEACFDDKSWSILGRKLQGLEYLTLRARWILIQMVSGVCL